MQGVGDLRVAGLAVVVEEPEEAAVARAGARRRRGARQYIAPRRSSAIVRRGAGVGDAVAGSRPRSGVIRAFCRSVRRHSRRATVTSQAPMRRGSLQPVDVLERLQPGRLADVVGVRRAAAGARGTPCG